ncbi:MAG: hypothetical protein K2K80_06835 [Clostridia bacterium]|nr:hypothetical protein [Clostridia bacterium]
MVFCIVTEGNAEEITDLPECDIAVFGFGILGDVDYERELKGETEKFEAAARLSKNSNCGLICACRTLSRGLLRKSASVADRGKLLGITDMTRVLDGEEYKSGAYLGLYRIGGFKLGVCIGNDLLFADTFKSLSECGCNAVIVLLDELRDTIPPLLIRAYSYLYGMPVIMCAGKTAYFADVTGAIASSNQSRALFEVTPQNRYHVVTSRVRGAADMEKLDY